MPAAAPLLFVAAMASAWVGVAQAAPTPRAQQLVVLQSAQTARSAPEAGAPPVARVAADTRITGVPTVLPVLAASTRGWIEVSLPGRPNGRTGWIRAEGTRATSTAWQVVVDLSSRSVHVFEHGRLRASFSAVVGEAVTPTPTGRFFVEEPVRLGAGEAGGPYALALSARSNVLQEFEGGPGQIAIHGRDNLGGTLGTAVSHGCIRLADSAIRWLVGRVGAGTPVTVTD